MEAREKDKLVEVQEGEDLRRQSRELHESCERMRELLWKFTERGIPEMVGRDFDYEEWLEGLK